MAESRRRFRWRETGSPDALRTDDIHFFDARDGWLVNGNGEIWSTADGGDTWTRRFPARDRPEDHGLWLRCIGFASRRKGWMGTLTAARRLYRTGDGGDTWEHVPLPGPVPEALCGLCVVDESVVYGAGTNDPRNPTGIVKSTDGGDSWEVIDVSEHASCLIDIHFFDESTGVVVGGVEVDRCTMPNPFFPEHFKYSYHGNLATVVLRTEDGGATWTNVVEDLSDSMSCGEWGWKVQFVDDRLGFVAVADFFDGSVLKTTDGGLTWKKIQVDDRRRVYGRLMQNTNLEGVGFIDEMRGWVGGWGYVFPGHPADKVDADMGAGYYNSYTEDGGKTWVAEDHVPGDRSSDPRQNVNRFVFIGDPLEVGYCSGRKVYRYSERESEPGQAPTPGIGAVATPGGRPPDGPLPLDPRSHPGGRGDDGSVQIDFNVPDGTRRLLVKIWSHFGWEVRTLLDEADPVTGARSVTWDGTDDAGDRAAAGAYMCRITVDGHGESLWLRLPEPAA